MYLYKAIVFIFLFVVFFGPALARYLIKLRGYDE
jgi:hypothetical protein